MLSRNDFEIARKRQFLVQSCILITMSYLTVRKKNEGITIKGCLTLNFLKGQRDI